jgi:hypothetical protein
MIFLLKLKKKKKKLKKQRRKKMRYMRVVSFISCQVRTRASGGDCRRYGQTAEMVRPYLQPYNCLFRLFAIIAQGLRVFSFSYPIKKNDKEIIQVPISS